VLVQAARDLLARSKLAPADLDTCDRWDVGNQHVRHGDCLEVLPTLHEQSVDVVVTSPPYNIGVVYNSYADNQPRDSYLVWLTKVGAEINRILRNDGSFFLNVGSTNSDPWLLYDVAACFRDYFHLQNHITWVKSISIGDDTVGHFKPITSNRYLNHNHEAIFHFTKTGSTRIDRVAIGVPFKDKSNIERWGHKADRRCAGNVWFLPYRTVRSKMQKFGHPAGFPVGLPERCIRLHGKKHAMILDPFLGAGTTLVAAEALGCRGVGIESDYEYARIAVERLQETVKTALEVKGEALSSRAGARSNEAGGNRRRDA
jgi:site-specific DNA-methyltransferase (adenine-specific)